MRGRFGQTRDNWLLYGTAGFAWSYDRLRRTQLAGTPAGGSALPGDSESQFLWRLGWAAGLGAELALASNWSAKIEYLATGFGRADVAFPVGAQTFNSNLLAHSIRVGLNYHLNGDAAKNYLTQGPTALEMDHFNFHGQTTFIEQYTFPFRAPYSGPNSLQPNSGRETLDVTFYAGFRCGRGPNCGSIRKSIRDLA